MADGQTYVREKGAIRKLAITSTLCLYRISCAPIKAGIVFPGNATPVQSQIRYLIPLQYFEFSCRGRAATLDRINIGKELEVTS